MNFLQRAGCIMALALGVIPLAAPAQQVATDYDHSVHFSQYHTYSWGHLHCSDALFEPRIKDSVDQVLQSKGWQLVPDGGDVTVELAGGDGRVRLTVRDCGLGIPPGEQERIFEKFYRLDPALTRGVGGSGLGLFISRELVSRMGGSLAVRSAPGEGAAFVVDLPAA